MKTILVQFRNYNKVTYCYKTKDETIKVGDILKSKDYENSFVVKSIINKEYSYVNTNTGELTDSPTSVYCVPIKTLVLRQDDEDTVYAYKL